MKVRDIIRLLEGEGCNAGQSPAIQASGPAGPRDGGGQTLRRSCARHVEQYLEAVRPEGATLIDGLKADGIAVPQPTSIAEYVET